MSNPNYCGPPKGVYHCPSCRGHAALVAENTRLRAQLAQAYCSDTGIRAEHGACQDHGGDACLWLPTTFAEDRQAVASAYAVLFVENAQLRAHLARCQALVHELETNWTLAGVQNWQQTIADKLRLALADLSDAPKEKL